jgi:lipoprotein-releasing system permease protein
MNGLTDTVANLYNAFEPDIRITATKGKYVAANDKLLAKIRSIEGVKLLSQTLGDKALLRNGEQQALVTVKGVDGAFRQITRLDSSLADGKYQLDDSSTSHMIIGRGIADQLQLNLHSLSNELAVFSPVRGKTGSLNPQDHLNQVYCNLSGIFALNDELDFQVAFVNLKTAQKLFDVKGVASSLDIACGDHDADDVKKNLQAILGTDYTVKTRYELNDSLFRALETEKLATFIILAFILVIATFNITGALTMLIIEKKRDIRTLYSMGATMRQVRNIFLGEGFLITGAGAFGGLILGLIICLLQMQFHFVKFGDDFVVPYYPVQLQARDFLYIFFLIMLIGFLTALYPVRVFTRMDLAKNA